MRLERSELFEISPPEDSLNLFQLKTELAIEKNLLQGQEFGLFVVSISIRAVIRRLEQARFIIEMKRAHAHPRYRGHLFDCIRHRFPPRRPPLPPRLIATLRDHVT